MTTALFDGTMQGESRVRMVLKMMGYSPDVDNGPVADFAERLLVQAELQANTFMLREITEAMRGEAAARWIPRR